MGPFVLIYFIVHLAFAEVFFFVSADSKKGFRFLDNWFDAFIYSWLTAIGYFNKSWEVSTDSNNPNDINVHYHLMWALLMLCQIVTTIVMLNLLIAIVGERYGQVNVMQKNYMYQERAEAIAQI